jgi:hypothetical protein
MMTLVAVWGRAGHQLGGSAQVKPGARAEDEPARRLSEEGNPTTPLEPINERHSLCTTLRPSPYDRVWREEEPADRGTSAGSVDSYRTGTPSHRLGQVGPTPTQAARGWTLLPCRHFNNQSC